MEGEISYMLTTKTLYRVPDIFENFEKLDDISQIVFGVWCTENENVKNMSMEEAWKCSNRLNGQVIDESIKNCLIFAFLDSANYTYDYDKFIEISFEDLIKDCTPIELVAYE